jgi:hypothetical protein
MVSWLVFRLERGQWQILFATDDIVADMQKTGRHDAEKKHGQYEGGVVGRERKGICHVTDEKSRLFM